ncbi:lysozyme inhibitor LprI family protein [Massilia violaceinigra]|nr:lysozyme inhibitor LprI family protein [Massilia violaceinigra]
MRFLTTYLLMALGVAPVCQAGERAAAPESVKTAMETCDQFSQADIRECLGMHAWKSATLLKNAQAGALAALGKWDEDEGYVTAARARLKQANTAFARYREAQCGFATSLAGGAAGNSHESSRLACVADLNAQRAQRLTSDARSLPPR